MSGEPRFAEGGVIYPPADPDDDRVPVAPSDCGVHIPAAAAGRFGAEMVRRLAGSPDARIVPEDGETAEAT